MTDHSIGEGQHRSPTAERSWSTAKSTDGTTIAWSSVGRGPGVIVIPGALSSADDYERFADRLSERFTVQVIERRGRGRSGPQGPEYGLMTEVDDVLALQARTGASFLVGHSFGGLIALEVARNAEWVRGVAVYEPGVSVDGSIPVAWLSRYERLLARGRTKHALAVFSRATGPDRGRSVPTWVMRAIMRMVVPRDRYRAMLGLLPQNGREHRALAAHGDAAATYSAISAPVLLMAGGRSGLGWVDAALDRLNAVLSTSQRTVFAELDHFGPDRGNPESVADAVGAFFTPLAA